jgi:hypothetical protein
MRIRSSMPCGRPPPKPSAASPATWPNGQPHAWRHQFAREMEWAPEYKGDELALFRGEIRRAQVDADRARRNAQAADTPDARQRLEALAAVHVPWERAVRDLADRLG